MGVELLDKQKVDYLLVGGYAVILHGYSRSTGDMDIWIKQTPENYYKLKKAYYDFGAPIFSIDDFENEKIDVWSIGLEPRKIEILTNVTGLFFDKSFKNCNWFELEKFKVPYIDFEDLMKNKNATGRLKDLLDIQELMKKKGK